MAIEYLDQCEQGEPEIRVIQRLRHHFDSRGYIGDRRWRVTIANLATGELMRVGDERFHHFSPSWSPDGRQLALITTRSPDWDRQWIWDVYTVSLDDMALHPVTTSSGVSLYPVWSSDGSHIAFLHNHSTRTGSTQDYHLWEASLVDGQWSTQCLSHDLDRGAALIHEPPESGGGAPAYSPDGRTILWVINDGGQYRLVRTGRDCQTEEWVSHLGWPSVSAAGDKVAALRYRPDGPPCVVVVDAESGSVIYQADENLWMAELSLCKNPQEFTVMSGGEAIKAWLWTSLEAAGPKPLLVHFHGGPHGAFGPYFSHTQQILASHGYLVAALNYRGSAGFGQRFADLVHAHWGPQEGEDGIRLIDALTQSGYAQANRVGVLVPSYGGFMTNWMLTHYPGRVQAGVAISTVSHLITSALGIDHWESLVSDQGGAPWDIPGYYHDHSPVMYADRVAAPLLLLHGEQDMTCPLIEAEMMFAALRMQQKPVELVRYVGESHAFHRAGRPRTMVDAHDRMLAWFQQV